MATNGRRSKKLSPVDAARRAREQMEELFGKPADSIAGISRDDNDGWTVTVELVELERIPDTTTLIGSYEVKLGADGSLLEAQRLRRYPRNRADPIRKEES